MKKSLTIAFLIVIAFLSIGCGPTETDLSQEIWRTGQSVYNHDLLFGGTWTSSDRTIGAQFELGPQHGFKADEFFVFPVPSSHKRIQSAKFLIVTRTGLHKGDVVMNLEIYDLRGDLQQIVNSRNWRQSDDEPTQENSHNPGSVRIVSRMRTSDTDSNCDNCTGSKLFSHNRGG